MKAGSSIRGLFCFCAAAALTVAPALAGDAPAGEAKPAKPSETAKPAERQAAPDSSARQAAPERPAPGLAGKNFFNDANGDGLISLEELPEFTRHRFPSMDLDGDGSLNQAEQDAAFERFKQAMAARRGGGERPESRGAGRFGAGESRERPEGMGQRLKRMDADGDGKLSREELPENLRANFERLDANGDGSLDAAEQRAALRLFRDAGRGGPSGEGSMDIAERFKAMDADGDGLISAEEASSSPRMAERFAQMDANGDGSLDQAEQEATIQLIRQMMGGAAQGDGPGRYDRQPPSFVERFKRFDANGDGNLALEELPEPLRERFAGADANADGIIDEAEGKTAFQSFRQAPGQGRSEGAYRSPGEAPSFMERFKRFDANGDGNLALEELPQSLRARFAGADANADGVIDEAEGKAAFQRPERARLRGEENEERPFGAPPSAMREAMKRRRANDADGSGLNEPWPGDSAEKEAAPAPETAKAESE